MNTLDLLDRAHTLLAKSALPKSQYDPISELLIRAKAELVAEAFNSTFQHIHNGMKQPT